MSKYFNNKIAQRQRFNKLKTIIGDKMELKELQTEYTKACTSLGAVEYQIKVLEARKNELLEQCRSINEQAFKLEQEKTEANNEQA